MEDSAISERSFYLELVDFVEISNSYKLTSFNCGQKEMNDFLVEEALQNHNDKFSVTTLVIYNKQLVGYYTLTSDIITLERYACRSLNIEETQNNWPAVKIARLAVDTNYQQAGLGTYILQRILVDIYEASQIIGFRFITLDDYSSRVKWYEKREFEKNQKYHGKIVSLRFDLMKFDLLEN